MKLALFVAFVGLFLYGFLSAIVLMLKGDILFGLLVAISAIGAAVLVVRLERAYNSRIV